MSRSSRIGALLGLASVMAAGYEESFIDYDYITKYSPSKYGGGDNSGKPPKKGKSVKGGRLVDDVDYEKDRDGYKKVDTTGRNEPCPCGSEKKYKKCCLNKVEECTVQFYIHRSKDNLDVSVEDFMTKLSNRYKTVRDESEDDTELKVYVEASFKVKNGNVEHGLDTWYNKQIYLDTLECFTVRNANGEVVMTEEDFE